MNSIEITDTDGRGQLTGVFENPQDMLRLAEMFEQEGLQKQADQLKAQYKDKTKPRKELKINKKLPQIIIPQEKIDMFMAWWDSDIRFEKSVPQAFDEGYLIYELPHADLNWDEAKEGIKFLAKSGHTTYRAVEDYLKQLNADKTIVYFKFINNHIYIERYEHGVLLSTGDADIGENSEPEPSMQETLSGNGPLAVLLEKATAHHGRATDAVNHFGLYMLVTAMWYIATAKSNKYIYENKVPVITSRHKRVAEVKSTKTINVPIYDMGKIKVVKTENLMARKKGWTYSHAFQVHGHYRHYKNGKVIFINSFIKGKGKEFKPQTTILEPKE